MSPPVTNSKHAPKSNDLYKKKKVGAAAESSSNARAHQLTNGDLVSSPKKKGNNGNSNSDIDFVRVKPKDQVPIMTFWSYLEPYFRPVTEEDREFLLQKGDDTTPYLIPPLGPYYKDVWAEEDRGLPSSRSQSPVHGALGDDGGSGTPTASSHHPSDRLKYVHPEDALTDDYLHSNDISSGTLAERLLSSLVAEDVGLDGTDLASYVASSHHDGEPPDDDVEMKQQGRTVLELSSQPPDAVIDFEERLKRELRYAGLFGDDDVEWNAKEDDEICAELRRLGRELKEQVRVNEFRKKRLLEVTDKQLQYEQYRHVLDNLDSQVEQCYFKRFRTQKSKKRKGPVAPKTALSENAVHAMEKRKMWIEKLGPIFKNMNMVLPKHSIYDTDTDHANSATPTTIATPSAATVATQPTSADDA
ncbi:histone acetyltransferases subunit 3-domain-containing protein [Gongronella butleri]|nr:histone acetyltransferases subunit 3-domain-containing protein [Gongronella butleri]